MTTVSIEDQPTSDAPLMNTNDVARFIGLGPQTLINWRCQHKGPAWLKYGNIVRYTRADVLEWLSEQRKAPRRRVNTAAAPTR